jgi:hypothetical protein
MPLYHIERRSRRRWVWASAAPPLLSVPSCWVVKSEPEVDLALVSWVRFPAITLCPLARLTKREARTERVSGGQGRRVCLSSRLARRAAYTGHHVVVFRGHVGRRHATLRAEDA